jgi:hypothetical protein
MVPGVGAWQPAQNAAMDGAEASVDDGVAPFAASAAPASVMAMAVLRAVRALM